MWKWNKFSSVIIWENQQRISLVTIIDDQYFYVVVWSFKKKPKYQLIDDLYNISWVFVIFFYFCFTTGNLQKPKNYTLFMSLCEYIYELIVLYIQNVIINIMCEWYTSIFITVALPSFLCSIILYRQYRIHTCTENIIKFTFLFFIWNFSVCLRIHLPCSWKTQPMYLILRVEKSSKMENLFCIYICLAGV